MYSLGIVVSAGGVGDCGWSCCLDDDCLDGLFGLALQWRLLRRRREVLPCRRTGFGALDVVLVAYMVRHRRHADATRGIRQGGRIDRK